MKELYLDSKQKENILSRAIALLGTFSDEILFTPPRVLQVAFKDIFGSLFGPTHTLASGLFLLTSLIANLGALAKLFNKNEINTLQEVLNNCEAEFGIHYDLTQAETRFQFEEYFNKDLRAKNKGYLQARIMENKNGNWGYDLKYTLSHKLTSILKSEKITYNQARATLNDETDKDIIAFLDKIIPNDEASRNKPISQLRQEALNKLTASAGDVASNAADFIVNDVPFQYWLLFFIYDISLNNDDAASWGLGKTIITIGGAIAISAVKFGGKIYQYFKDKFKAEDKAEEFTANNPNPVEHKNSALKHQQLTTFFLDNLEKHNSNVSASLNSEAGIEFATRKSKPWYKKLASRIYKFYKTKNSKEHIDLLRSEIDENSTSFRRKANSVTQGVTTPMIQASFFEWVVTVATPVFSHIPKVAEFFSSAWSNFVDLGSVIIGGIIGAIYYRAKTKSKLDAEKTELTKKVEAANDTFNQIEELEVFIKLLKKAIKDAAGPDYERLRVVNAYDDRASRRLTTEKTKGYTSFKKFLNRLFKFIGCWGTGVLFIRITLLSALKALAAVLSATTFAAVSAIAFPIVIGIALGVGVLWGAVFLYKYTFDQRLEEAKQFLADKEVRLETAKKTFHTYKNCLEKLNSDHEVLKQISVKNIKAEPVETKIELPKPAEYKPSLEKLGLFHAKNKPNLDIQTSKPAPSEYSAADLGRQSSVFQPVLV